MNHPFLSAVIICFNEERNIVRCLESLEGVADEVVVVDSGSTDATVELARSLGARVLHHPFEGHIQQKNWAAEQAGGAWILSLDADEALGEKLKANISLEDPSSRSGWLCLQPIDFVLWSLGATWRMVSRSEIAVVASWLCSLERGKSARSVGNDGRKIHPTNFRGFAAFFLLHCGGSYSSDTLFLGYRSPSVLRACVDDLANRSAF